MMKFSDHPDHNRNISVEFDDEQRGLQRGLPAGMVLQVKYLDDKPCGDGGKAIRLDNEIMHLLKAAPALLEACKAVETFAREGFGRNYSADERLAVINRVSAAVAEATKTTY